ncbi:hypothetical protein [Micromonospora musae]|uniref:Uncharacterized protein n=1 Tax=Micromonospora musae TaxID=1894970 RepID=A0A3A9XWI7_9ACTN|nr:hypothetical protein [Micromonospora musae]RKN29192.1 hypothetical protein D7044_23625 [Micromonospora musae]
MRVVAALALTLAMAPAPQPSTSPSVPSGLLGGLVAGLGDLVDGLLGAGDDPTAPPTTPPTTPPSDPPSVAPTTPGPSVTSVPVPGPIVPSVAVPSDARPNGLPGRVVRPGGDGGPDVVVTVVPQPAGAPEVAPSTSESLAVPTVVRTDPVLRWAALLFSIGVLALPVVLLVRRRPAPADVAPAPVPARGGPVPPGPDEGTENVTRLPTNLNAIYELGRLDERLAQERERRS